MEALTKFAINSTLGTDKFEPLDKIIQSSYTLVQSDNTLKTLIGAYVSIGAYPSEIVSYEIPVVFNITGEVRFKISAYTQGAGSNFSVIMTVISPSGIKSGHTLQTVINTPKEFDGIFAIKEKGEYIIKFEKSHTSNNSMNLGYFELLGTTIGGRVFDEVIE